MWPLPVSELFMVGRRTAPRLKQMGIHTIGELANYPLPLLEKEFKSYGKMLHAYANGIDDSPVVPETEAEELKSIGNSTTTSFDVEDQETAYKILLALSETVSMRLRGHKVCAQEIAVTFKSSDFKVYSHQKQLMNAIDCTNAVYETAKEIFDALRNADIYVRYFNSPRIDNYLRITIGTKGEMEKLFSFLRAYLNK